MTFLMFLWCSLYDIEIHLNRFIYQIYAAKKYNLSVFISEFFSGN